MSTITFNCTAGILTRGRLYRAVQGFAWLRGYDLKVEEAKGLLASLYHFELIVPDPDAQRVYNEVQDFLRWFDDDNEEVSSPETLPSHSGSKLADNASVKPLSGERAGR